MSQEPPSTLSAGLETNQPGMNDALASVVKVYVESLIKDKSSNKRIHEESDSLPEKDFQTLGRMYGRQGNPFLKVDAIVNFGLKHETIEETDENPGVEQQELQPR
ncbi:hypothetical protein HYPSUDRAFT_208593 [Hypholoma sublateritium FD-334 SS-4]|uniref:Uncharacterized protein n=1 Tax=Hypholoma sublateritium (strain FD-334 SS-4) TaxID=945553 RepID=A0A0D2N5Z8_HYPSF|nr:hypothetical protein HYPSUDRAFT_208593 [Hypholoma sublateritium FD-334 SS-4]